MNISPIGEPTHQTNLRLWPGIVLVALQWLSRFGVKAVVPGIKGFGWAVMGSLAFTLVIIVWWAFFSRARRSERWGGLALIGLALGGTWLLKHDSMWFPWLVAYAIPVLSLAFVAWAVFSRHLSNRLRWATMVATLLVACGGWLLLRQDGINGDHNAKFGWRWAPSPEERLLAQAVNEPAATATPVATTVTPTVGAPAASPTASASPEVAKDSLTQAAPPAPTREAEWPGFRGPRRDGIVRGVRIKTDWADHRQYKCGTGRSGRAGRRSRLTAIFSTPRSNVETTKKSSAIRRAPGSRSGPTRIRRASLSRTLVQVRAEHRRSAMAASIHSAQPEF